MNSDAKKAFQQLYPEMDEVQLSLRQFSLGCVAHRLRKFGFEGGINYYQPRDLMALSLCLPVHCRSALIKEAIERGFNVDEGFNASTI